MDPHPQELSPDQRAALALSWVEIQRRTQAATDAAWVYMLKENVTASLVFTETSAKRPIAILVAVGEEQIAEIKSALDPLFTSGSLEGIEPDSEPRPKSVRPLRRKAKRKHPPKDHEQHDDQEDEAA